MYSIFGELIYYAMLMDIGDYSDASRLYRM